MRREERGRESKREEERGRDKNREEEEGGGLGFGV
jgi:hypothetical protein